MKVTIEVNPMEQALIEDLGKSDGMPLEEYLAMDLYTHLKGLIWDAINYEGIESADTAQKIAFVASLQLDIQVEVVCPQQQHQHVNNLSSDETEVDDTLLFN